MGAPAGTAVALPCPVVRISVTGGVTVPVDKTEEVSLGDRVPEPAASPGATFARGSEPFARVLVDDSQTRVVVGDPNSRVLVDDRHTRVLAGFPHTRVMTGEPTRTRRASEPNVEPERYDLGNVIGRGGMGEVVAAQDVQIGREVAIKRLHAERPTTGQLARFLREARIQGRLEHPAIPPVPVRVHDDQGRPYFVMRKLEGVTLAETLRNPNSPFTRQRLLRAFVEICHAIDLAHSKRIVHRDIKPANILLGPRGEVFVLDWGIARELDAADTVAGIFGTPGYMPPEQLRGDLDIDERVDIYALGCVLFEILEYKETGDPPLELASACDRAMQLDRARRFTTVDELCEVVQRYLDGDRDLEQRRAIARHHLACARDAFLSQREDDARRAIVMREAGKALALDPSLDGAAELIGRIMLEPPTTKPAAVEQELRELDMRGAKLMSRVAIAASLLFVTMLPTFILLGIRDVPYLTAYGTLSIVMLGIALVNRTRTSRVLIACHVVSMGGMFALLAHMFSPLLVSPMLAVATLVVASFNPLSSGRRFSIVATAGLLMSILGVWAAEWLGILTPTVLRKDNGLLLLTVVDGGASFPAGPVLGVIFASVFGMAGTVCYVAMREIRLHREKLVMQAWHLRQLV
jgi:serine/threonine-protein kinase